MLAMLLHSGGTVGAVRYFVHFVAFCSEAYSFGSSLFYSTVCSVFVELGVKHK